MGIRIVAGAASLAEAPVRCKNLPDVLSDAVSTAILAGMDFAPSTPPLSVDPATVRPLLHTRFADWPARPGAVGYGKILALPGKAGRGALRS